MNDLHRRWPQEGPSILSSSYSASGRKDDMGAILSRLMVVTQQVGEKMTWGL
jgi:hypothetical protein